MDGGDGVFRGCVERVLIGYGDRVCRIGYKHVGYNRVLPIGKVVDGLLAWVC